MTEKLSTDATRPKVIFAAAVVGSVCMMFYAVSPVLLGKLTDTYGLTLAEIGWLAGLNMLGLFLPNITGPIWINRVNRRQVSVVACLIAAALYAVSSVVQEFMLLSALMLLFGCATGAAYGITLAVLGEGREPDRGYAISFLLQVSTALFIVLMMSNLAVQYSFLLLSGLVLLGSVASYYIPSSGSKVLLTGSAQKMNRFTRGAVILGLIAIVFVLMGESALWTFLERIAIANNYQSQVGSNAVMASLVAAAIGSGGAAVLSVRLGRVGPMIFATALSLASVVVFAFSSSVSGFYFAAVIYGAAWNFGAAFRMGFVASADQTGRWVTFIPATQMFGAVIGPIIAGQLAAGSEFSGVYKFAGTMWVLGLGFFILGILALKKVKQTTTEELET